jgi:hypothetical protein
MRKQRSNLLAKEMTKAEDFLSELFEFENEKPI